MSLLALAIGIGLVVSLIFSELFGLAAGGLVVPGYFALYLTKPVDVAMTIAAGLLAYTVVAFLSRFLIIYGKRRTVLMILAGYLLGAATRLLLGGLPAGIVDVEVIGYIIPGLIAIWLDRQGLIETLSALLSAAVVVRLILILVVGQELHP